MSILERVNSFDYLYFGFDPSKETAENLWYAIPCLCGSNDGVTWEFITYLNGLGNLRDGNINKINDVYYLMGTLDLYKTSNFIDFEKVNIDLLRNVDYTDIWAPELFKDLNGQYRIVYSAKKNETLGIYMADFDPISDVISNPFTKLLINPNGHIDPTINVINNTYYMQLASSQRLQIFSSKSLTDIWTQVSANHSVEVARWYEAPEWLIKGDQVMMFQDRILKYIPGVDDSGFMVYQTANVSDLANWSEEKMVLCSMNMRHGSFIKV